jgi:hypothetical protein
LHWHPICFTHPTDQPTVGSSQPNWKLAQRLRRSFLTLREVRMKVVPTFCLALLFSAPLHAQVCSGGAGGGIDATGNQCGDFAAIGLYANGPEVALPPSSGKMRGIEQSTAAAGAHPATKMSVAPATSNAAPQGASRLATAAPPPNAPVQTSKIEKANTSPCAGGADGGMDATGNQCAEYVVAGASSGVVVAAKR